jgi:hypothetical protein
VGTSLQFPIHDCERRKKWPSRQGLGLFLEGVLCGPSIGPEHAGRPSITLFMLRLPPSRRANPFRPAPMPSWAHCFGGRPGDAHHGDLATDHGAAAVHTEANKAFGGIDILINNAGAYEARPWICS